VLVPIILLLTAAIKALIDAFMTKAITQAQDTAFHTLAVYAREVVQSCYQQIIKPVLKELQDNPENSNARHLYENALKTAKLKATKLLQLHLQKLPGAISNALSDKIDGLIESSIPAVKKANKNPT